MRPHGTVPAETAVILAERRKACLTGQDSDLTNWDTFLSDAASAMNERTLARRLAAEDLIFSGIQEDMRQDLARHYLADASHRISRIAWPLGFQEVSAFTQAFKRWTGQTPTQMRSRITEQASSAGNAGV
jgi:methylphosphotriester-DNA--protein-cysteine methyltransferase